MTTAAHSRLFCSDRRRPEGSSSSSSVASAYGRSGPSTSTGAEGASGWASSESVTERSTVAVEDALAGAPPCVREAGRRVHDPRLRSEPHEQSLEPCLRRDREADAQPAAVERLDVLHRVR